MATVAWQPAQYVQMVGSSGKTRGQNQTGGLTPFIMFCYRTYCKLTF